LPAFHEFYFGLLLSFVKGISYDLAQSDPIKQCPLYQGICSHQIIFHENILNTNERALNGITDNWIYQIIESFLATVSQYHQLESRLVHWEKEFG
jgi:hypothetical protein